MKLALLGFTSAVALLLGAEQTVAGAKNVVVYKAAGRYAGWPANHGIWIWGNEIVVGFESGRFKVNRSIHAVDYSQKEEHLLARSKDGGETWTIEKPLSLLPPPGGKMAGVPTEDGGKEATDNKVAMDFNHRDFALTARMMDKDNGPSRFYYSYDRGKTWRGPFHIPTFGTKGIMARTDYIIDGPRAMTMFITAALDNSKEGRVLCVRTTDGGVTWNKIGVASNPGDKGFSIMPSSVRLSKTTILSAIRRKEGPENFIELTRSDDDGATWKLVSRITPQITGNSGNPPAMVRLKDGRLVVTYGHRAAPLSMRARISADEGATWGDELILRQDGGDRDLGYPRTVIRPDGKLVTVYYFNDSGDSERYIAATIWSVPGKK
jgi:Neuraminidase (sialidase)